METDAAGAQTSQPKLTTGRRPTQKRSQARVQALLNAADLLLQDRDVGDIGLYDVAHEAKVPPTSAYHFFPTRESVFLALAQRYLRKLHDRLEMPLNMQEIEHWHDFVSARYYRVVDYFNESIAARKLFIGMALSSDVKKLDFQDMSDLAESGYRSMDDIFEMPYVRDSAFKFSVVFGIQDGIWATSYAKHGLITPEYAKAGLQAALAYMSTFLPAVIAIRSPEAVASRADRWKAERSKPARSPRKARRTTDRGVAPPS